MSKDTEHTYNNSSHSQANESDANEIGDKRLIDDSAYQPSVAEGKDVGKPVMADDTEATESLEDEDFSEDMSEADKENYQKSRQ